MRYPLRFIVPLSVLVAGLVAAAVAGIMSLRVSDANTEKLVIELLTTVGNQAAADVAAGVRRDNPSRISNAIEQLKVSRRLEVAMLLDGDDRVLYATRRDYVGQHLAPGTDPRLGQVIADARARPGQQQRIIGGLLYYTNHLAGVLPRRAAGEQRDDLLLLIYDLAAAKADQRAAAVNQALVIVLTVLALSIGSWLLLSRGLLSRIAGLVHASRRIGEGDLRTPVDVTGSDEIATLGQALDNMRQDLRQKRAELRSTTEDLEAANATVERERARLAERVEERTRDLKRTNRELEHAKEAAEAGSRAKSAFLATVSHEIRTPMNGVLGAMELLERSDLDEHNASLLRTAQESARSLLALLNDLLDMAKIEAGRIEISYSAVSPRVVVDHVVAAYTPAATANRNRLAGSVADATPDWVVTDALRLQQILGNLVSNAVKFTDHGDVAIHVTPVADDGTRLAFTVRDTGVGIDDGTLRKLFQPFEQGPVEVARQSGGTGLGLAICRGLAGRLGGSVTLESTPGKGTVATLELPVELSRKPRSDASAPERAPATEGDIAVNVLVVDDHPVNRTLQVRQIEQLGATADSAGDGVSALAKLRAGRFDIVVTDCEMPRMDGFQLARAIRESDESFRDVPIVACTAHALPDINERCRAAGMNDVLTKPIRLNQLADMLRAFKDGGTPAADTGGTDGKSFNEDTLLLLTGGDPELRENIVQAFLSDNRTTLEELNAAMAADDLPRCREIAHRNKGACAIFGATALGEAYARMEQACTEPDASSTTRGRALERLRDESHRLEAATAAMA